MALTVEDGTGVQDADTWISLADADAYLTDRNNTAWEAEDSAAKREAALRVAADYLAYVYSFPGQPTSMKQRLPWPRAGVMSGLTVFPASFIPNQIIEAQLLLAVAVVGGIEIMAKQPDVVLKRQVTTVGKVSSTKEWDLGGPDARTGLMRFPMVDNLLQGLGTAGSGVSSIGIAKLVRA